MKQFYRKSFLFLSLLVLSSLANAQFSGLFAPANWGTTAVNSNGLTYTLGAPASVSMSSSDGLTGVGTNDFTITITQAGIISFGWIYSTIDGPNWDYPMVLKNGVANFLTGYSTTGLSTQTGNQACVSVLPGDIFGFRMHSVDNAAGAATTIFNNFTFSTGTLTIVQTPATACPNTPVTLTASNGTNYVWSGGITNGVAFTPAYPSPIYSLTSGPAGCTTQNTIAINYYAPITVSTSANPFCAGNSVTLTAGNGSGFSWSGGGSGSSIVVAPTSNTSYTVTGTSTDGCTNSNAAINLTVSPGTPTLIVASSTSSLCLGKTATLTASGALSYTWSNGVTNGVSFFPSTTTTYTVSGQNGCGITTAVTTISVLPIPLTLASTPAVYCTNSTATLSATTPANTFTWEPGNIIGTSPNIIVNPSVTTVYTLTVSDGTCSGTSQITLNANQVPTISIAATNTIMCPGDMITLTASGGNNYTWSPGGQTGPSIMVAPTTTSLYTATGDNVNGCTANSSQVISVGAQPTLVLSASHSTICAGSSATLTISGAGSYLWSNATTGTINVVSPGQSTNYSVIGTHPTSQCTASAQHNLEVYEPVLSFSGNTVICNGDVAVITANGATNYTWNPVFTLGNVLSDSPSSNTIYSVSAMSSSNNVNCPINGTVEVIVNPLPVVSSTLTRPGTCVRETNTLTASGASTYTWVTTTTTVAAPTLTFSSNVATVLSYTLHGTSALGCQSQSVVAFNISGCTGINETEQNTQVLTVYPNPNSGKFVIQAEASVQLNLHNELGQLIESINLNEANAYKTEVKDLAKGVYFITGNGTHRKIIVH